MKRTMILGTCLLFTATLGCSPDADDDDDDQTGGSITLETLNAEFGKAYCKVSVCEGWQSPTSCTESTDDDGLAEMKQKVAAGRVSFDGEAAKKCLDEMKKIDPAKCWGANASAEPVNVELLCATVFKGLVANGDDCYTDDECAAGVCHFGDGACPGTCVAYRTVGQSCAEAGEECAPGLWCNDEDECVARAGENESCEGSSCADGLVCNAELVCVKPAAPGAAGADCDPSRPCEAGLFCDENETGKCVARQPAGGECFEGSAWGGGDCQGRQICTGAGLGMDGDISGKCSVPQDVGGPCVVADENAWYVVSGCYESLLCDPATSKCVARPKAGQPCVDLDCAWDAYCNDEEICVAQKAAGETCEFDEECSSYFCLENGTCGDDSGENECPLR